MVTKKPKGLGRGLDALLGADTHTLDQVGQATTLVSAPSTLRIAQLQAGKYQPRTRMDEGALAELADSIRAQGIMQPILVRPLNAVKGQYEIIAGERRFRAAQLAGLTEVPVLVKDVADEHAAAMALIENIQREDLNPLEEAQGVKRLIEEFGLTHEQAATAIGRSRSATSNLLRLLNLAAPVQTMLLAGDIDMGHARALLAVEAAIQIQLANQIIAKRLSVRDAEALVTRTGKESVNKTTTKQTSQSRDVTRLEETLSDQLGTKVSLKIASKGRGQLIIDFHGWDHCSSLIEKLNLKEEIDA
jgi:ParB family chromosome partitioning protein